MWDRLGGIEPSKLFRDKSRKSSDVSFPIFEGIFPVKLLPDKFNETSWIRSMISGGISGGIKSVIQLMFIFKGRRRTDVFELNFNDGNHVHYKLSYHTIYILYIKQITFKLTDVIFEHTNWIVSDVHYQVSETNIYGQNRNRCIQTRNKHGGHPILWIYFSIFCPPTIPLILSSMGTNNIFVLFLWFIFIYPVRFTNVLNILCIF